MKKVNLKIRIEKDCIIIRQKRRKVMYSGWAIEDAIADFVNRND